MLDSMEESLIEDQPTPVDIEGTKLILFQMENCICKIVKDDGGTGTGFFCIIPFPDKNNSLNVLITNNHVLNENDIKNDKIIKLIIYNKEQHIEKDIRIDSSRKKFTILKKEEGIDITFIEIKPNKDKINNFLEIDDKIIELECKRKSIYILHYPKEKRLVSYGLIRNINEGQQINHYCYTEKGSSGSPILSLNNFKVIGVHYGASKNKINFGTFIKNAIKEFNNKYKNENENENKNENNKYNQVAKTIKIITKYKIGKEDKIRIFGDTFVKNNKSNFHMKINGKNYELNSFYKIKNEKENEIFNIKLKQIKNVTNLSSMFEECFALIELPDISKLDTNKVIDMSYMFSKCINLSSLPDISKWDTKNVTNMKAMFQTCSSLFEFPGILNWNTNKVIDMSYMFTKCSELSSLPDISKWNTNNVNNMECMFNECSKLSSLPDISKWKTNNVINMSAMFQLCSSLTKLPDISKWNTNNVTDMSCMFNQCNKLLSLPDISKWNTKNVSNMFGIFNQCSNLTSLPDISRWNTNNVNTMAGMFQLCSSLTQLPDISKWKTNKVTDMRNMFYGCSELSSLPNISKWNTNNVTNHENIFKKCSKLSKLPHIFK